MTFPMIHSGLAHVAVKGGEVAVVRPATLADADKLRLLHEACSERSLRDRYLGAPPPLREDNLNTLLTPPGGRTLLALSGHADGEPLAIAHIIGAPPVAEFAVLVRDGWQGRGLGSVLARQSLAAASRLGYREVVVFGAATNTRLVGLLRHLGLTRFVQHDGSMITAQAPLETVGYGVSSVATMPAYA